MNRDEERSAPSPAIHAHKLTGRIIVNPAGYGFVVPEDKSEDVHVAARNRGAAMDADTVEVEAWLGARGREGRVLRVVARGRAKLTGQIAGHGTNLWLAPDDPRLSGPVSLRGGAGGARPGQAVVAEITRYPDAPDGPIEATVLKVLGDPDDPRTEVEKVLACADVSEEFPAPVAADAETVPHQVRPEDLADRADLRHVPFTTIDPETARDFDDAVALEPLPGGGHRLWVAVADVSHYVRESTAIDAEARRRGCSIYLPNRAIPMLPESLSAHMCSLVPEEDRLAMVTRIDLDADGRPLASDFMAAVIHSRARLDYPGVAAALAGEVRGKRKKYEPHLPALRAMDALARRMRQSRLARGALDLDLPEPVVELDHDDPRLVRDVRRSRRDPGEKQAYSMIEEFMLAANEAVARSFTERGDDCVWRIHDAPDEERLADFARVAEHYGIAVDLETARTPRGLKAVLDRLHGHPAEKPLSFQLLRSLKQATYDVVNLGHFGLAARDYLHFTSPIRRYPDLVAHRLMKLRLASQGKPAGGYRAATPSRAELARVCADASFAERAAMEIEREVVDLYRAFFLRDRVGDLFEGSISGVTSFGVFVVVDQPFVEGLVRIENLGDDFYDFDGEKLRLEGRRTGRSFALGDAVKVEVETVSVVRRKIDFVLHEHAERRRRPGAGAGRGRGREPSRGRAGGHAPARAGGGAPARTATGQTSGTGRLAVHATRRADGPAAGRDARGAAGKTKDRWRDARNKGRPHKKGGKRK